MRVNIAFVTFMSVISLHCVCGYKKLTLHRLCPSNHLKRMFDIITDNRPEVFLELDHGSGAIVHQHWNASTVHKLSVCRVRVDARQHAHGADRGVYATVRRMKLRKQPGPAGKCIDFVAFKRVDEPTLPSERLCGDYVAGDDYTGDESKFFADESGVLYVHVELDTERSLGASDELDLEIVLTAYERSPDCGLHNRTVCSPGRCIAQEFHNDGIINCPPLKCADEDKCAQQVPILVQQPISGLHIAISAITSLLMTMICVLCVYMCCKCKYDGHATMAQGGAGSSATAATAAGGAVRTRSTPIQRIGDVDFQNIELPSRSGRTTDEGAADGASSQPMNPSAPELDDKDMPPSYESLFKKQQNNVISV